MNQLYKSNSLYLQQHAQNPVHWQMWDEAVFERAKHENKPVLVSIGYAACHWCHVMERESFEDPTIAALMNEYFICIKVDREEHPAVDHLYMDAIQAMRQQGGWPLNMFVTPDKKPFYGGTYFPPKPIYGRPSWKQVLEGIRHLWINERENIDQQSEQLYQHLHQVSQSTETNIPSQPFQAKAVKEKILEQADEHYGGFGLAPKFPSTMLYQYLLDYELMYPGEGASNHAIFSLKKMLHAGIYDKVHGGLCRYATDDAWMIPHFEKMLYDNALLISVLSKAYQASGEAIFKDAIHQTIDFCQSTLYDGHGYKSAIDADSEGVEGKYYTYTWEELMALDVPDVEEVLSYYNCQPSGNWESVNILHADSSLSHYAKENEIDAYELKRNHDIFIEQLKKISTTRTLPAIDDKKQLSWNALMNLALSDAYAATGEEKYLQQAEQHITWMEQTYIQDGRLMHIVYDIQSIRANADDWAYWIAAYIRLAEVSGKHTYWELAKDLFLRYEEQFSDKQGVYFYFSSNVDSSIPIRKLELHDTAQPSVNAVLAGNLMKIGMVFAHHDWMERAWIMQKRMQSMVERYPNALGYWGTIALQLENLVTVQIIGEGSRALLSKIYALGRPHWIPIAKENEAENLPCIAHKPLLSGAFKVYECSKDACSEAYNSIEDWLEKKC